MKNLTITSIMAAIIFVTTAYIFHIPVGNGYVHIGDSFIFIAASILSPKYAILASIVGATLADGLTGYAIWIIPSAIIKGITALMFTSKNEKIICKRNVIALGLSLIIGAGGYSIATFILYQSVAAALTSLGSTSLQVLVSAVIYLIIGNRLDAINFKEKYFLKRGINE